jgi:hypothetical protein
MEKGQALRKQKRQKEDTKLKMGEDPSVLFLSNEKMGEDPSVLFLSQVQKRKTPPELSSFERKQVERPVVQSRHILDPLVDPASRSLSLSPLSFLSSTRGKFTNALCSTSYETVEKRPCVD